MRWLSFLSLILLVISAKAGDSLLLNSPGKRVTALLKIKDGNLKYSIHSGTQLLLASSDLGIRINDKEIGTQVNTLRLIKEGTFKETSTSRLNSSRSLDHHTAYTIKVIEKSTSYTMEFKLFDNGCAFRYLVNESPLHHIEKERTIFTLPTQSEVWFFERNSHWKLKSYAGLWQRTSIEKLPTVSSQGPVQGKPIVAVLPEDKYLVIAEAALYNYSGMRLKAIGEGRLQVDFTEGDEGFDVVGAVVTPWRVVLYANGLNELVNNHVIEHLNPKPDKDLFKETMYIRPGRSVWSWITRNEKYLEPEEEKKMVDAAAALHFEYTLIDEGWEVKWKDKWEELRKLCEYASIKNVKVWVWKHSKELMNTDYRDKFLDSIREAGAVGIKTDFMNSEAKKLIDFEIGLLQATARRKLMVNFHGCHTSTGESKTYPNELTREGIRGLELNIMNEPIPEWHNAALPFTRFITGHGDYTPGFFTNRAKTTIVHQLALFYLFNSPFQCMAENPNTFLTNKAFSPIRDLLTVLPVTWDETIVLSGSSIGQLAAFARRKGKNWYVAIINGQEKEIEFNLVFSFLPKGKPFKAVMISDAASEAQFEKHDIVIHPGRSQPCKIAASGGLVLQIKDK